MLKLDNNRKTLYQWDVGVIGTLTIDGVDEVHFSNLRYGVSFNIKVVDNKVEFPPEVLQSGADVFCWAFVREQNGGYTKKEQIFNVEKRPRPADYVFEPTEILSWETLKKEIEKLDEDTTEALAGLEEGTIKVMTEQVNLWELETGIYYLNGGFKYATTSEVEGQHILIIYKLPLQQAVRYIHFCGENNAGDWSSIDCGFTTGTFHEQYSIVDTSRVVSSINDTTDPFSLADVQAVRGYVKEYVNEQLGVIENGSY